MTSDVPLVQLFQFIEMLPSTIQEAIGSRWILVVKHSLDFLNNEPQDANQEEHSKWFDEQWWDKPKMIIFYDTEEEALEAGIKTKYGYWWIVYDSEGKRVDGGY